jgi:hypothetical protein
MQPPSVASSIRTRLAMMQNSPFNVAFCKLLGPILGVTLGQLDTRRQRGEDVTDPI